MARAFTLNNLQNELNSETETKSDNSESDEHSDSDLDEVSISLAEILYVGAGKTVMVDSEFFKSTDRQTQKRPSVDTTTSSDSGIFDPTIPPMAQIIGATPEYIELLKATPAAVKELIPEFTESDLMHPENVYWNYPRAVKDFKSFENRMVPITHHDGIKKLICKEGQGEKLKRGDNVRINFYVYVEGKDCCIQSNKSENKPYSFQLGRDKDHIPVLSYGTLTMKPKEVAAFLTTSKYGYGQSGYGNWVPANARTLCIIEVLSKLPSPSESSSIINMVSAERKLLPFEDLFEFANKRNDSGNRSFKKDKPSRATRKYLEASKCLQDAQARDAQQEKKKMELLHCINSNICHVNFANHEYKMVAQFAQKAIELPIPEKEKAHYYLWCSRSLYYEGQLEEAKSYLDQAGNLLENNKEASDLKNNIAKLLKKSNEPTGDKPRKKPFYKRLHLRLSH